MKNLRIEKYVNNRLDESFQLPIAFIRVLSAVLPQSAVGSLIQHGFDFDKIIEASKHNQPYQAETVVEEKGVEKKISLSLL